MKLADIFVFKKKSRFEQHTMFKLNLRSSIRTIKPRQWANINKKKI